MGYLGIMQENSPTSPSPVSSHSIYLFFTPTKQALIIFLLNMNLGYRNKRVCIDLSCWMVQLQNVSKSHFCLKEKVYLKGLFHRLRALIAVNCSIVFVSGTLCAFLFVGFSHFWVFFNSVIFCQNYMWVFNIFYLL